MKKAIGWSCCLMVVWLFFDSNLGSTAPPLKLENSKVSYKFVDDAYGPRLDTITNRDNNFVMTNNSKISWVLRLWNLDQSLVVDVIPDNSADSSGRLHTESDLKTLTLDWKGVQIPGSDETLDVTVTIDLPDKSQQSSWNIWVNAQRLQHYALWSINFPVITIAALNNTPADDYLYTPYEHSGILLVNPIDKIKTPIYRRNPGLAEIQLRMIYDLSKNGLYYATLDPNGHTKDFIVIAHPPVADILGDGILFAVEQWPGNMLTAGLSYSSPYSTVVQPFRGDWYEAAKIYREWALQQAWAAEGPLKERTDVPEWLKDVQFLLGTMTDPEDPFSGYLDLINDYKESLDLDLRKFAVSPFPNLKSTDPTGRGNPDGVVLPPPDDFLQMVKQVEPVKILPYINGRLWDPATSSWDQQGEFLAVKDVNLEKVSESYGGPEVYVPDPYPQGWRSIITDIIEQLIGDGTDSISGVFIDQVSLASGPLCFDSGHGHPVGGGTYWREGAQQLLSDSRLNARQIKSDFIVASEGQIENYLNILDVAGGTIIPSLYFNSPLLAPPPVVEAVYHDYARSYGGILATHDIAATSGISIAAELALHFVRGHLMAALDYNPTSDTSKSLLHALGADTNKIGIIGYLKALIKASDYAGKFLKYGELVRPLALGDGHDFSEMEVVNFQGPVSDVDLYVPKVPSSVWKADDGSLGLVFTNYHSGPMTASFSLSFSDYGISQGANVYVSELKETGRIYIETTKKSYSKTIELPSYSVYFLEMSLTSP